MWRSFTESLLLFHIRPEGFVDDQNKADSQGEGSDHQNGQHEVLHLKKYNQFILDKLSV